MPLLRALQILILHSIAQPCFVIEPSWTDKFSANYFKIRDCIGAEMPKDAANQTITDLQFLWILDTKTFDGHIEFKRLLLAYSEYAVNKNSGCANSSTCNQPQCRARYTLMSDNVMQLMDPNLDQASVEEKLRAKVAEQEAYETGQQTAALDADADVRTKITPTYVPCTANGGEIHTILSMLRRCIVYFGGEKQKGVFTDAVLRDNTRRLEKASDDQLAAYLADATALEGQGCLDQPKCLEDMCKDAYTSRVTMNFDDGSVRAGCPATPVESSMKVPL